MLLSWFCYHCNKSQNANEEGGASGLLKDLAVSTVEVSDVSVWAPLIFNNNNNNNSNNFICIELLEAGVFFDICTLCNVRTEQEYNIKEPKPKHHKNPRTHYRPNKNPATQKPSYGNWDQEDQVCKNIKRLERNRNNRKSKW